MPLDDPEPAEPPSTRLDDLLRALGRDAVAPPEVEALLSGERCGALAVPPAPISDTLPEPPPDDPLAELERRLRQYTGARAAAAVPVIGSSSTPPCAAVANLRNPPARPILPTSPARSTANRLVLAELEAWLAAIHASRAS